MNKKIFVGSVLVAALLILVSLTSVVGTNVLKSNVEKGSIDSPLFAVRSQRSVSMDSGEKICSRYLGKGEQLDIFLPKKSMLQVMIDKAIKIFDTNPGFFDRVLARLDRYPYLAGMLNIPDMNKDYFSNYMGIIENDPSILTEEIENIKLDIPIGDDIVQPLGLDTSNFIGCLVTAIVFAPVVAIVTLLALFFTLRIFTCLNVNDCANNIAEGIWDNLIQGLIEG